MSDFKDTLPGMKKEKGVFQICILTAISNIYFLHLLFIGINCSQIVRMLYSMNTFHIYNIYMQQKLLTKER